MFSCVVRCRSTVKHYISCEIVSSQADSVFPTSCPQVSKNKNTFCGTRYLFHCCSLYGAVVEILSHKYIWVTTLI